VLLSNAVTLRRDKSILFSRVAIIVLLYSSLFALFSLFIKPLANINCLIHLFIFIYMCYFLISSWEEIINYIRYSLLFAIIQSCLRIIPLGVWVSIGLRMLLFIFSHDDMQSEEYILSASRGRISINDLLNYPVDSGSTTGGTGNRPPAGGNGNPPLVGAVTGSEATEVASMDSIRAKVSLQNAEHRPSSNWRSIYSPLQFTQLNEAEKTLLANTIATDNDNKYGVVFRTVEGRIVSRVVRSNKYGLIKRSCGDAQPSSSFIEYLQRYP